MAFDEGRSGLDVGRYNLVPSNIPHQTIEGVPYNNRCGEQEPGRNPSVRVGRHDLTREYHGQVVIDALWCDITGGRHVYSFAGSRDVFAERVSTTAHI